MFTVQLSSQSDSLSIFFATHIIECASETTVFVFETIDFV